jgi:5-methylcytosine-specific restriction endonuclease McrA
VKTKEDQLRYQREYYARTGGAKVKAKTAEYRKRNLDYITELKATTPCADCGNMFHPAAMDFDHLGDKKFTISGADVALKTLMDEIAKCEIVCSNCHRIRTWLRRQ